MNKRVPKYSKLEHAQRGYALYQREIRPRVEENNLGKVVAIDIDTGAYEVAENSLNASKRLLAHYPDAQIWCIRVGHEAVYKFGILVEG